MKKRYPRGHIYSKNGWSGIGEEIEQSEHGIYYFAINTTEPTIFVPYSSIDRIKYDTIPKELRAKEGSDVS